MQHHVFHARFFSFFLFGIIVFTPSILSAYNDLEFYVGLKGGASMFHMNYTYPFMENYYNVKNNEKIEPIYSLGLFFTNNKYAGIEIEFHTYERRFHKEGYTWYDRFYPDIPDDETTLDKDEFVDGDTIVVPKDRYNEKYLEKFDVRLTYLNIPVLLRVNLPFRFPFQFYLNLGFGVNFIVSGKVWGSHWNYIKQEKQLNPRWEKELFERFDMTYQVGLAYELPLGEFERVKTNAFFSRMSFHLEFRSTFSSLNMEQVTRFVTRMFNFHLIGSVWIRLGKWEDRKRLSAETVEEGEATPQQPLQKAPQDSQLNLTNPTY